MSAQSEASADLRSDLSSIQFKSSLSLIAAGAGSTASLEAHTLSNDLSDVPNPTSTEISARQYAPLLVFGALSVTADNSDAKARANLSSDMGLLSIGGNLQLQASGSRAESTVNLTATYAIVRMDGDVSVVASGDNSHTELQVGTQALGETLVNLGGLNGQIEVIGNVRLTASGTNAISEVSMKANPTGGIQIGKDVDILAAGTAATAKLSLASAELLITPGSDVNINGSVRLAASSANGSAEASLTSAHGNVSIGNLSLSASGIESHAKFMATAAGSLTLSNDGMQVLASGDHSLASVQLSSSTSPLTINGAVNLIASGDASEVQASLISTSGKLAIAKDVSAAALAEGSEVNLTLSQVADPAVTVAGQIRLISDSGSASTVGATTTATLTLGKFGAASTDLAMSAMQSFDYTDVSLKLFGNGGVVRIGGTGQSGTAVLTLTGDAAPTGNKLVDLIDIDFTGKAGHAVVNFDVDQDSTTENALSVVKLSGFRLDNDSLHFGSVSGFDYETGISSLSAFKTAALEHFNDSPLAGVFAAGASGLDKTFIAYDIDGSGISSIIELDGVRLTDFVNRYQSANGLG